MGEYVELNYDSVEIETDEAFGISFDIDNEDTDQWIPKSVIDMDNFVVDKHTGECADTIFVAKWFVEKEGLDIYCV